ncbi:MAG: hypothetical protein AAF086_09235 [Planctomycetota bacterium]
MTYLEVIGNIEKKLSGLGVSIPIGSRYDQATKAMHKGWIVKQSPDFPAAKEGFRDLLLLDFILHNLPRDVSHSELTMRLNRMLKDPIDPILNKNDTPGRNLEHEMYIAAVCQAAGLKPRFAEPDVIATHIGQDIGFAAKRMRNWRQFEKHCRKASKQIQKTQIPGWIVCEMTHAFQPDNSLIPIEVTDEQLDNDFKQKRIEFIGSHIKKFDEWFRDSDVRAIVTIEHFINSESSR